MVLPLLSDDRLLLCAALSWFLFSGSYISIDMKNLPTFWLAYLSDPSDSGRIHSNIRQRWLNGMSVREFICVWISKMLRNPAL